MNQTIEDEALAKEGMAAARKLKGRYEGAFIIVAAIFGGFFLFTTLFGLISQQSHIGIYVLGTFALCFMLYKGRSKSPAERISLWDGLVILGLLVVFIYYIAEYPSLADRIGGGVRTIDVVFGWFLILCSLEVARRVTGKVIPLIGLVLLIYAYLGPHFPLGLSHAGFSLSRIAEYLFLTGDGILGMIANIFASYILLFVMFGTFMQVSGCGKVFVDLAYAITGTRTGGPGLAAVVTSASFGTVSGSAVANVVVDGVFTIPLMKRLGYPPHFAAAVEASASTGGQLMPPIMGAAVFLMAEITATPYVEIIKIAAIPACLYFASVGVMIYLEAVKRGLRGLPASELPQYREILKGIHLLLPIPILISFLVLGFSPYLAAFYSICATIAVSWLRKNTRMGPEKIIEALVSGVRASLTVGATVGVIGIVIGVTNLTGLANYFQQFITALSGGHLFLLLFLLIIAGTFIGMGLPTTAAYVVLVILGVPALIKLGVAPVTAHLLAFWISVQSNVTPPVALAAWAASAIAKSDPWKTGWTAAKLASWIYIMPFLFVYTSLLKVGWNVNFLITVVSCLFSLVAWGAAVEGYLLKKTNLLERVLLFVCVFVLLHEGLITDLIGYSLLVGVIVSQKIRRLPAGVAGEKQKVSFL
ncbi:MAG: TRAP transporter fused permease subunit [Smithellaceae bacterium]|nr:TRAP transporter fused permease subunit [Smithellaceae bacterium]